MAVEDMKKGYVGDDKEFAADTEILFSTYLAPESDTKVHVSDVLRKNLQSMVTGEMFASHSEVQSYPTFYVLSTVYQSKHLVYSSKSIVTKSLDSFSLIYFTQMLDVLVEAQDQAIQIMADSAFPRFLLSEGFQNWRDFEKCSAKVLIESQAESAGMGGDGIKSPVILKMSKELDNVLMRTSWLAGLLSSVESLPVCISLAAASKTMKGFPLIYVNAAFENCTGYDRDDVIGKNCNFLQRGKETGHVSEPQSIARLSKALRNASPVKVAITNFKKDGTPFRNLLAMKPILDQVRRREIMKKQREEEKLGIGKVFRKIHCNLYLNDLQFYKVLLANVVPYRICMTQNGNYAFVIGCQFDVGHNEATAKKMKMIDDLFRFLPQSVCTNT